LDARHEAGDDDVGMGAGETICLLSWAHTRGMAHLTKPHFGTRHHKPRPLEAMSDSDKGWQVDWLVVAVVTVVFVAGFFWLF
jgi:hypothetical protein